MAGERRRYVVGVRKIPYEQRDIAHSVITPDDDRSYMNILRADDDDPAHLGKDAAYVVELTDEEAARFRTASNLRYIELDRKAQRHDYDDFPIPQEDVVGWMGGEDYWDTWHGRDVLVAICDDGTTAAARNYMEANLVARRNFALEDPGSGTNGDHGCLVLPCLLPYRGRLLDAIIAEPDGAFSSVSVAGWIWAADQGARIINYSYGSPPGGINRVSDDGFRYLAELGAVIFISAGNDSAYGIGSPANYSRIYPNVISVGNFNHRNNTRRPSSNHHPRMSGVAPGDNVAGLTLGGQPTTWSGTSASSPHAAQLAVRMMTGGHFTAMQVATALKNYTRDTGQPDSEQGGGAFDMGQALGELLKSSAASNPAVTARAWRVVSGPAQVGATLSTSATLNWTPTTAGIYTLRYSATHPAGTATDDVVVTVNQGGGGPGPGPGGTPKNPGEALWIGTANGKNHFNVGIGRPGGGTNHDDYDQTQIQNGFDDPPWFTLTENGDVQFRMNVEYGRTSSNTRYARCELRELKPNGDRAAWNSGSGLHYMQGRSRVMRVAPTGDKPEVCFFQMHDSDDDIVRVITTDGGGGAEGLRLRVLWTPPGGDVEQSAYILNAYDLGQWIDWRLEFENGTGRIFLDNVKVWEESNMGSSGCYFKTGCYNQANTDPSRGGADPGDYFAVEMAKGSLQCWHTGYPEPTTPVFTG